MKSNKILKVLSTVSLSALMTVAGFGNYFAVPVQASTTPVQSSTPETNKVLPALAGYQDIGTFTSFTKANNVITFTISTGEKLRITFLTKDMFRLNMEPTGTFVSDPTPNSPTQTTKMVAKTQAQYEAEGVVVPTVTEDATKFVIASADVELTIFKSDSTMQLKNLKTNKVLWKEAAPLQYSANSTIQTLTTDADENFYGGGMQNGRFTHKGQVIKISNTNNWVDGGVASPNPFYVSSKGYGVMRQTWKPGSYDFGNTSANVITTHNEKRFDAFYFVGDSTQQVITEYQDLTGKPMLMPEYAYYVGHLNCFNRPYKDGSGDTEKSDLMVDAVAIVDSYIAHDMPLGFVLPNDGYGCGYGKESTQQGNLDNLKNFVDYAKSKGVRVGLWTQSALYPVDPANPLPDERNIDKEVGYSGVSAVKTDVAWVGAGYSMALHAVQQASTAIEAKSADKSRGFVISLDGWAGTQRYAGIWSGDQYGGQWEYIRFHIPTYIGQGLSGNPNMGSDLDGIFGGADPQIRTRDYQWKAFTPIMLSMDGWSGKVNLKNPWQHGDPYDSINRMYLKLKASMMPYNYTTGRQAYDTGNPMVRAMLLAYPNDPYTQSTATQYQYMWGDNFLVAPVYNATDNTAKVRNGIYLPDANQVWIDYFTGDQYKGGTVLNNFSAPLWKLPLFVKNGAIIPMTTENNSPSQIAADVDRILEVYPAGSTSYKLYEDDGFSTDYKANKFSTTNITSVAPTTGTGTAVITVEKTVGTFTGMATSRGTQFVVNVQKEPTGVDVKIAGANQALTKVTTQAAYDAGTNVYFYNAEPNLNKDGTGSFKDQKITTNPKLYVKVGKTNITTNNVVLTVTGFDDTKVKEVTDTTLPTVPANFQATETNITDKSIKPTWDAVANAQSYDIMVNGVIYSNITTPYFLDENVKADTVYSYKVRAVNTLGTSAWSAEITPKSLLDRYRNVIPNMVATSTEADQSGSEVSNLVDGDDNTQYHSNWSTGNVLPNDIIIDCQKGYDINKFTYLPRPDIGNGTILNYTLSYSLDGKTFKDYQTGTWARTADLKTVDFTTPIYARYVKVHVTNSVGSFMSGQEMRIYKVDGTEGSVVGDYAPNGAIDQGELTFLENYTGIKVGDASWEYASRADINYNGIVDAYDMAFITSKLNGGIVPSNEKITGNLVVVPSKETVAAGEEFELYIVGNQFTDINALSMEINLDTTKYEMTQCVGGCPGVAVLSTDVTKNMLNYSSVRFTEGSPVSRINMMFANAGNQTRLNGTGIVGIVKVKAKVAGPVDMAATSALIVDSQFKSRDVIGTKQDLSVALPSAVPTVNKVTNSQFTLTGDNDKLQAGQKLDKLIDGNKASLAELIWDVPGATLAHLPLNMTFTFNEPTQFTTIDLYKRANGNGSLEKAKAIGYLNGVATDLGTLTAAKGDTVVSWNLVNGANPNGQKFDRIDLIALSSYSGDTMLSLAEVEFKAYSGASAASIAMAPTNVTQMAQNSIVSLGAIVSPTNAVNKYYTMVSSDPSIAEIIRVVDADGSVSYLARGNKQGEVDITVTSVDGSFVATQKLKVGAPVVDKAALNAALVKTKAVPTGSYSTATYNALQSAITAAQAIADKTTATQAEVDAQVTALNAAYAALATDKAPLNASITAAKAEAAKTTQYTAASIASLNTAITAAETVAASTTATQTQLDAAKATLDAAKAALVAKPVGVDKTLLQAKVDAAKALKATDYTAASYAALTNAITASTAMISNTDATQADVNAQITALDAAVAALVAAPNNRTELQATIAQASAFVEENFTLPTWTAMQDALTAAKAADKATALQSDVDAKNTALKAAIAALAAQNVDKTALNSKLAAAKGIEGAAYTPASFQALQNAITAAQLVSDDKHPTQAQVDAAAAALDTAVNGLETTGNAVSKDALTAILATAKAINGDDYTAASFQALADAIAAAQAVADNPAAKQGEIDNQTQLVQNAINALVNKPGVNVDKTALNAAIAQLGGLDASKYTAASYEALQEALVAAQAVANDPNATQAQIDMQIQALSNAFSNLVLVQVTEASKDDLKALVNTAKAIDKSLYTAESFKHLLDVVAAAEAVLNNPNATQAEINTAYNQLAAAIQALQKVTVNPETKPDTRDNTNVNALFATTILALGAAVIVLKKRKEASK